ncbi:ParB N-terminal domain-containing protein [Streptomyces anulatus]|uniref:ParB N-terminal domain-containing protein n=1 Tax=Streptomyces anulatus TaxID=1892 RepID=UPI003435C69B
MPTTPDRPADQLRAAAEKLRAAAAPATPGPWKMTGVGDFGWSVSAPGVETPDTEQGRTNAELIALLHPGVGLEVARWLESWAGVDLSEHGPMPEDAQHALAVARQLLGTSTGEDTAEPGAQLVDRKQPAYDAVFAYIRSQPSGFLPTTVVERNAIIWRAVNAALDAAPPAPADRAAHYREAANGLAALGPLDSLVSAPAAWTEAIETLRRMADQIAEDDRSRLAGEAAAGAHQTEQAQPDDIQVWPLTRVLTEVRCGSQDWTWEQEWADLDQRHAETGYLDRLEQQIKTNGITMPVLIGSDGRLWDGHHRLRIAVRLGIGYVPVEITPPAAPAAQEVTRA